MDLSLSRLTRESAQCIWDQGYRRLVVGIRYNDLPLTANNLNLARAQGFDLDAYAYLWLGGDVRDRVRRSIAFCQPYGIGRMWLDWEDDGQGNAGVPPRASFPPSRVVDLIGQGTDACDGFPHGQYSGGWWWRPATGDSVLWRDDPWWAAEYDGVADLSAFTPFGGISRLAGKQYAGTTGLCGVQVDLNVFRAAA